MWLTGDAVVLDMQFSIAPRDSFRFIIIEQ